MEMHYDNEFHESLRARMNKRNFRRSELAWRDFVTAYPQCSKYEEIWLRSHRPGVSPLSMNIPWINFPALEYLRRHIRLHHRVFEWGMGGSTTFFLKHCRQIVSVEHSKEWFLTCKEQIEAVTSPISSSIVRFLKRQRKSCIILREPSAVLSKRPCFSGVARYHRLDFHDYIHYISTWPQEEFDIILIDGRARMHAAELAARHVKRGGLIIIDNSDYRRYQLHIDALRQNQFHNWEEIALLGPGPFSSCIGWKTTIFKRP